MNVGVRLTYLVATLALVPALVCLIPLVAPGPVGAGTLWTFVIASVIAAVCLIVEWRRDRYALAMFGTVWTFLVAMVAGSLSMLADGAVPLRGVAVALVAAALLAGCIAVIVIERRMVDEVPDHLVARIGTDGLFESDGVVWAVTQDAAGGDLLGLVTVLVQVNVAAPRTVRLELEDVAGFWSRRGALAVAPVTPFEVPAGGLACCCIPVAAGWRGASTAHLYLSLRARGPAGRRIRKHRGKAVTRRTTNVFRIFALLGGHLVWGGGVRATFTRVVPRSSDLPPPPPTWRMLAAEDLAGVTGVVPKAPGLSAEQLL